MGGDYCGAELHDELAGLIERLRELVPPFPMPARWFEPSNDGHWVRAAAGAGKDGEA